MLDQKALQGTETRQLLGGMEEKLFPDKGWLICPPCKSIIFLPNLASSNIWLLATSLNCTSWISCLGWIVLQNCHLASTWMSRLVILWEDEILSTKSGTVTVHRAFRLWLTTFACRTFPSQLLQSGSNRKALQNSYLIARKFSTEICNRYCDTETLILKCLDCLWNDNLGKLPWL